MDNDGLFIIAGNNNFVPTKTLIDTNNNNFKRNEIHRNIFTSEELLELYQAINNAKESDTKITSIYCQKIWFTDLPQNIKNKVTEVMTKIHNRPVKLEEISFARYSKEYGDFPSLTPHYDNHVKYPRVTLDVQLNSNMAWPIIVESKAMVLKNNEAATFSGTHQIHWRSPIVFKDNDFIEMLFCHFSLPGSNQITIDELRDIDKQLMYHTNRFAMRLMIENEKLKVKTT